MTLRPYTENQSQLKFPLKSPSRSSLGNIGIATISSMPSTSNLSLWEAPGAYTRFCVAWLMSNTLMSNTRMDKSSDPGLVRQLWRSSEVSQKRAHSKKSIPALRHLPKTLAVGLNVLRHFQPIQRFLGNFDFKVGHWTDESRDTSDVSGKDIQFTWKRHCGGCLALRRCRWAVAGDHSQIHSGFSWKYFRPLRKGLNELAVRLLQAVLNLSLSLSSWVAITA
jgi:hypothetical protein